MIENFNGSWFLMIKEFDGSFLIRAFLIERDFVYYIEPDFGVPEFELLKICYLYFKTLKTQVGRWALTINLLMVSRFSKRSFPGKSVVKEQNFCCFHPGNRHGSQMHIFAF